MTIIFNGKAFAKKRETKLAKKISELKRPPILAIILIGGDNASHIYVNLKQKAAAQIGIKTKLLKLVASAKHTEIINIITELNSDISITGILVQLPLPINLKKYQKQILQSIKPEKDSDGLRINSPFLPATVKAILSVLEHAKVNKNHKILIVGAKGAIGSRLLKKLKQENYSVKGVDKQSENPLSFPQQRESTPNLRNLLKSADVIISATGSPNLIKADMVKRGVIALDIGSPKGDIDKSVYAKASFITPVPGGIGPMTIISLLENLASFKL